jgi:hypothetical protein
MCELSITDILPTINISPKIHRYTGISPIQIVFIIAIKALHGKRVARAKVPKLIYMEKKNSQVVKCSNTAKFVHLLFLRSLSQSSFRCFKVQKSINLSRTHQTAVMRIMKYHGVTKLGNHKMVCS